MVQPMGQCLYDTSKDTECAWLTEEQVKTDHKLSDARIQSMKKSCLQDGFWKCDMREAHAAFDVLCDLRHLFLEPLCVSYGSRVCAARMLLFFRQADVIKYSVVLNNELLYEVWANSVWS